MFTENITCVWNDVACLNDDRAVTFVCKTLFQLPAEITYCRLDQLKAEKIRAGSCDGKPCGELCLTAVLEDDQAVKQRFSLGIPFTGDVEEKWQLASLNMTYLQGQLCQDRLLIEAVMSHQQEQQTRGGRVLLGEISLREILELQEDWPEGQQILGSQVLSHLDQADLQEGQRLSLTGNHLLAVLYETQQDAGEKVFIYQELRPFQAVVPLTRCLDDLVGVHLEYQSLTVQLIAPRKILLNGIGVLFAEVDSETEKEEPGSPIQTGIAAGGQQMESTEERQKMFRATVEAALQEVLGNASAREAIGVMLSGAMNNSKTEGLEHEAQKQQEGPIQSCHKSFMPDKAAINVPETNQSPIKEQSQTVQEPAAENFSMEPLGIPQMQKASMENTSTVKETGEGIPTVQISMEENAIQESLPPEHRPAKEKAARISQREQLAKYMRNLNGMVRDPYCTKNFELQQEQNREETDH